MTKLLFPICAILFLSGCSLVPAGLYTDHPHTTGEINNPDHHQTDHPHTTGEINNPDHHQTDHPGMGINHMDHSNVTSEQQFVVDMIPHHQEAVDTSKIVLPTATNNSELSKLLSGIIGSQTEEISMMKGRISTRYPGTTMTSSYQNMMPDLTQLTGSAQINAYLQGMIIHHQGAVQMAQSVLTLNPRSEIKEFAQTIIIVQQAEIEMMKGMMIVQ